MRNLIITEVLRYCITHNNLWPIEDAYSTFFFDLERELERKEDLFYHYESNINWILQNINVLSDKYILQAYNNVCCELYR